MNHKNKDEKRNMIKENNLTYDDYAEIDDQRRYELVQGQLELMSPSPSTIHQLLIFEINEQISLNCKSNYFIFFSPIDVIFSSTEVRQPDLALVNKSCINILSNRGIEGAPDLVVEILSPSSLKRDKIEKLKTYAEFNIPEYWIVDPNSGFLEQYILTNDRYEIINIFQGDEQITSPNISCISFTMKEVMDQIPQLKENHS
ncbi:Uma2 family endonuclease [Bacillus sp. FSL K6-3431]|uniref:Uma2 family endonuclease n=1 Tax=Bacillus sp. FSL K6-3431 TaxID=2921500 RepID=UPI0030F89044